MSTPMSLLVALRQPNQKGAWDRFVELYTPLLYRWAHQLESDPNSAADLVQDIFVTLLQALPAFSYESGKSFRAWLRTILTNQWRDRCRQRARRMHHEEAAARSAMSEEVPVDFLDESEYRRALIGRALELIRPDFAAKTWQAFTEHGVQGRPAATVGAELGLSANAVYQATFRIMRRVRIELNGLLDPVDGPTSEPAPGA